MKLHTYATYETHASSQRLIKSGLVILIFVTFATVIIFWSVISTSITPYKLHVTNTICVDSLNGIINKSNANEKFLMHSKENEKHLPSCNHEKLVGRGFIDTSIIKNISIIEKTLSKLDNPNGTVDVGGKYQPIQCNPQAKVAIIIPYRNRYEHLKILLRYLHPFLQRQQLYYRIFVVDQIGNDPFNRASLLNIGFQKACTYDQFDCFVFHDVDHLPQDDRNFYGCKESPMHLAIAVDKFRYNLPYGDFFGGVNSFKIDDYKAINGMSNLFWGWGGEDDDIYGRVRAKKLEVHRPSVKTGRYTTIKENHFRSSAPDPNRMKLLESSRERMEFDGLNTLKYKLVETKEEKLYTIFRVQLARDMYKYQLETSLNRKL